MRYKRLEEILFRVKRDVFNSLGGEFLSKYISYGYDFAELESMPKMILKYILVKIHKGPKWRLIWFTGLFWGPKAGLIVCQVGLQWVGVGKGFGSWGEKT